MHANQTPAQTTSTIPSNHEPVRTLPVRPPVPDSAEGPADHEPDDGRTDEDTEEAGYGYGV